MSPTRPVPRALPGVLACALLLPLVAACGGGGSDGPPPGAGGHAADVPAAGDTGGEASDRRGRGHGRGAPGAAGEAVVEVLAPGAPDGAGTGVVHGVVLFEGEPPVRPPLVTVLNTAGCHEGDGEAPLAETVIVQDGKLVNAVVYLRDLPDGTPLPAPPSEPLVIDQHGCLYVPHVSAVQVGRPVRAGNSDRIPHNVRVTAVKNPGMNKTIGPSGSTPIEVQDAETLKLACDIHPWMAAWVLAFEHPWFAVTGADGAFRLEGVPPGTYGFEAWHERFGRVRGGELVVGAGGEVKVTVTYTP